MPKLVSNEIKLHIYNIILWTCECLMKTRKCIFDTYKNEQVHLGLVQDFTFLHLFLFLFFPIVKFVYKCVYLQCILYYIARAEDKMYLFSFSASNRTLTIIKCGRKYKIRRGEIDIFSVEQSKAKLFFILKTKKDLKVRISSCPDLGLWNLTTAPYCNPTQSSPSQLRWKSPKSDLAWK